MHVGLLLPEHGRWDDLVRLTSGAERVGVESLWLADAPADLGTASGDDPLEPLMTLAGLARVTTRARLGVLLRGGARPPAVAAKALSTIDVLSGGRVIVGLDERPGAGTAEAEALGESVVVLRGAFGGGPFTFHGQHHRCEGLRCRPLPLQRPAPPIWISGTDRRLVTLAARHGDGWGPSGSSWTVEEYLGLAEVLDQECESAGRDPADVQRFVCHELAMGGPGRLGEEMEAWRATGVTTLIVDRRRVALAAASGGALEDELEILESAVSSAT